MARACYDASPEHAGTPEELIRGRIGGLLEIVRARLRSGTQDELGDLARDVVDLAMGDRPPPEPLRLSMRPPKAKPESLDAADHSERAIRAFALLAAERGYRDVKIEDVVRLASMSTTTFYANFAGKEDLMAAAIDSACAQALAAVVPAFNRQTSWPDAVRAGFGALLNFLASRPALARLVTVEVYGAGDEAIERRAAAMAPLGSLIENNTTLWGTTPSIVFEMIAGGVAHLIHDAVRTSGPEALPSLAPICTYLTLFPFLGSENQMLGWMEDGVRITARALNIRRFRARLSVRAGSYQLRWLTPWEPCSIVVGTWDKTPTLQLVLGDVECTRSCVQHPIALLVQHPGRQRGWTACSQRANEQGRAAPAPPTAMANENSCF